MNRKIDIGEDKNYFIPDRRAANRPQSKFLMDDLAKSADDALNDARRVAWNSWVGSEPLITGFVDEDGKAYLFYISEELKNKVVLLDIWDYTLLPCRRSLSYVREWHTRYGSSGLTIIGVHSPMFKFGTDKKNVIDAVRALDIKYPVVMDNGYDIWRSLDNRFWPRRVLIDSKGRTQQDYTGEGGYQTFEKSIQLLLREVSPGLPCPPIMKPLRKIDDPDYNIPMTSTEIFLGTKWAPRLGNVQVVKGPGEETVFTDTGGPYAPDLPYFAGAWVATTESMYGSSVNRDAMKVAINFTGTDAYIVAGSRAKNQADVSQFTKVKVTVDGKQIAIENLGGDTTLNDQHQSTVTVRDPKLYHVVKGLEHKSHEMIFEFSANSTDVMELFAFFFEHNA